MALVEVGGDENMDKKYFRVEGSSRYTVKKNTMIRESEGRACRRPSVSAGLRESD